jgi:ATPase family associated with various cellular activities (AAA)
MTKASTNTPARAAHAAAARSAIQKLGGGTTIGRLTEELDIHIRARYPLIAIDTFEEGRFVRAISALVAGHEKHRDKPVFQWSRASGLLQLAGGEAKPGQPAPVANMDDPLSVIEYIGAQKVGLFILCDFSPYLYEGGGEDPRMVRHLRELAWKIKSKHVTVFLVEPNFPDIPTLSKEVRKIELPLPCEREVATMLDVKIGKLADNDQISDNIRIDTPLFEQLVQALRGLTETEIDACIAKAAIKIRGIGPEALPVILDEKKSVIKGTGAVTYAHPEPADNLGGYGPLRRLLEAAAVTFTPAARARNVDPMKGILLIGLPGTGKDLTKRVASSILNKPLLNLDMAAVMGEGGGVIGSGAMSIKRALAIAETVEGILGISEFEKGVAGLQSSARTDGGETARTIGCLLNWMADQNKVFVFATANDISNLQGEQVREGRFSHIAFVDNPKKRSRMHIASVHLRLRNRDPERFDVEQIADASPDYSGAEIEGGIKGGILRSFMDDDRETTTDDVVYALRRINPISKVKADYIRQLREWARSNMAINADDEDGDDLAIAEHDERAIEV